MNEILVNANYRHEKTGNNYHTLLLSSNEDDNQQIVYIDRDKKIWSKKVSRFLNGMTFLNKEQGYNNIHEMSDFYPNTGDFYYDVRSGQNKAYPACSVLYVTNIHATHDDYPVTVFYLYDGLIKYLPLEKFNENFKK